MITPKEVKKAKGIWAVLLKDFLIQRGWTESTDGYHLWSKSGVCGSGTFTDEEAFWAETKS